MDPRALPDEPLALDLVNTEFPARRHAGWTCCHSRVHAGLAYRGSP